MGTYKVIAGAHCMDGRMYSKGATFENGGGIEQAEHFSRCFKKVAASAPVAPVAKEVTKLKVPDQKKVEQETAELVAVETPEAQIAREQREAEELSAKLKVVGWPNMEKFAINSQEMKNYFRTKKGKAFLKTEYGSELVAELKQANKSN